MRTWFKEKGSRMRVPVLLGALVLALAACNSQLQLTQPRAEPASQIEGGAPVPASVFDVPVTRVMRQAAPYRDFGPHDAAVREFIMQATALYAQEHVHKEVRLDAKQVPSFGVYANQTMYQDLRMPANPQPKKVAAVLFAPTMFGPGDDCIEAVNVYLPKAQPEVWAWDWCESVSRQPAVTLKVDKTFVSTYIRTASNGLPEYAVETLLGRDGKTWNMALYNRSTRKWDTIYQTSGSRKTSGFPYGPRGWDMYEMYSGVNTATNIAAGCDPNSAPIGSNGLAISFDPTSRKFTRAAPGNAGIGRFQDFHCPNLRYHMLTKFSDWNVTD
jgi:hypothetical protein